MDKKIGIIGGGQLGKMLMEAGIKWNLNFNVLDQNSEQEAICKELAKHRIEGSLHNTQKIKELAALSDVLTYEIEDVNVNALCDLEKEGYRIIPYTKVLNIIQDKGCQKDFYIENNIPTVDFYHHKKDKLNESFKFQEDHLVVIKHCRGGYDGKGVQITNKKDYIFENTDYIIEKYIDQAREFAVIVACDQKGTMVNYPVVQMVFNKQNILKRQICPAPIFLDLEKKIINTALSAIKALQSPGIFAVELIVDQSDNVYVNEISPRPHNSGHYTIESCKTSQYEQLLRILLGFELGPVDMIVEESLMFNLLGPENHTGQYKFSDESIFYHPNCYVHLYGKYPSKPFRKLGHVTITTSSNIPCKQIYKEIKNKAKLIPAETQNLLLKPIVGVIMGSKSDYPVMEEAVKLLQEFCVPYEVHVVSAHRTPERMYKYAKEAEDKGLKIIIAGAGGAAHLPGMTASLTNLPVIGVPIKTSTLSGLDSLYSIVQMPTGVPVATTSINGAKNAALIAVKILALTNSRLKNDLNKYNQNMVNLVLDMEKEINEKNII